MGAPDQVATAPASTSGFPLPYRAILLQRAFGHIPVTAEGLPVGYYRVDLLPTTYEKPEVEAHSLRSAYVDLSFEHGYPTLGDGRPFWHKLEFEPGFAYGAFQIYLDSLNEGPRELTQLAQNEELIRIASQVQGLSEGQRVPSTQLGRQLYEFSILYYWRARAKAHDLYKEAAYRHLRLRRQMTVEDEHYTLASNLLRNLKEKVLETPAFFDNMSAKTAVDLLARLIAAQRVSVGLPAAGPLSQKETPEDMTFEMILRTLGSKLGQGQGNTYDEAGRQVAGRQILSRVLADPEAAQQMQELVIRVAKSTQTQGSSLDNPFAGAPARRFKGRGRTNEIINGEDLIPFDVTGAPGENLDSADEPEGQQKVG